MIKTIISIVIIAALACLGWVIWKEYDKYNTGRDVQEQQQAAVATIVPEQLQGMPNTWENGYKQATNAGVKTWTQWMKVYGQRVADPRRAWIELDYMVRISTDDPQEAKAIFATVKERITDTNSPVYPRIQQLAKTYE